MSTRWRQSLLLFLLGIAGICQAQVNLTPSMTTSQLQTAINGAAANATINFAGGTYPSGNIVLPCSSGRVYNGAGAGQPTINYVGIGSGIGGSNMTLGSLPTVIFSPPTVTSYAFTINSNGSSNATPGSGCTIQGIQINGTGGGFFIAKPSSGVLFQYDAFTNNNPAAATSYQQGMASIQFDGSVNGSGSSGISNASILWSSFYNNCVLVSKAQYQSTPSDYVDNSGRCAAIAVGGYSSGLTIKNNVINQVEEGMKFTEQSPPYNAYPTSLHLDIESNNLQGNERIMFEDQQPTDGVAQFSHNAIYQPSYPWANTFEISWPVYQGTCSNCVANAQPATVTNDNVLIGNVPITLGGSGAHYGIGNEQAGSGSIAQYNLMQGGNGADTCAAGFGCSGWSFDIGFNFSNVQDTNNYASGYDAFHGGLFDYEGGASSSIPGLVISPNTVVATSTTMPTQAPTISPNGGNFTSVTLSDSDTNHRLSIFYTTDGSTPCIFAPGNSCGTTQLYSSPFTISLPSTVCAIAQWGQGANQGIVFPSFGWVPSSKTCASFAGSGGGSPALTGVTVTCPLGTSVGVGSSLTCQANCSYTGVSTPTNCSTADQYGTDATFASSNLAKFTVNASGVISGVAPGTANLTATAGVFVSSALPVTVTAPAPTLTGASISGPSTLQVGQSGQASPTCSFSNGSQNSCFLQPAAAGATYYISPSGSDSNSGTSSGSPWLTPNHALNCGDVLQAASGSYSAANFQSGKWGTVSCPAGNNVAWLACATFDACKISSSSSDALWIDKSYWGVQGWETTVTGGTSGACFHAGPSSSSGVVVHHVIFANDVANGCMGGGFNAYSYPGSTTSSVDYIVYLGNIAYNAAQGAAACYSGLNVYQPIAFDSAIGTHLFADGNFSYNNVDGCASPTDGEGVNFDTLDYSQGGGTPYVQQAAAENNIAVSNGGRGVYVENNGYAHSTPGAPVFFKNNTAYGNNKQATQASCIGNGDIGIQAAFNAQASGNIAMTDTANGCAGISKWAFEVANANATDEVSGNWLYSAAGNTAYLYNGGGFSYGTNTLGPNPAFSSVTVPGAPSCGSSINTVACMATLIANFTPTASGTAGLGYQPATATSIYDPLYPQWLCAVTLPAGVITPGCSIALTWASGAPSIATISASGAISALAVGSTGITVQAGSLPPSAALNLQVTSATPPAATLNGVNLLGVPASIAPTQQVNLTAQCTYSDGSTTTCNTADSHGTTATGWTSSNTAVATLVNGVLTGVGAGTANLSVSAGSFSSTVPVTVVVPPTVNICGNNQVTSSFAGTTAANYENAVYCVTPTSNASWAVSSCSFFLPAGTQTSGAKWDCLVTVASSTTAQAAAPICVGTYTTNSTSSPAVWVSVPMGQVGNTAKTCTLSAGAAYWIGTVTSGAGTPPQGFWNCGSTCSGSAPSSGNGTYKYFYVSQTYGSYAGNATALNASTGSTLYQPSEYVTLATPPPTLVSGFLQTVPSNGINALVDGQTVQFAAYCQYSDGTVYRCDPGPNDVDPYGNTVTAWQSSSGNATVGNIGSAHPGLATAVSSGSANISATLTGSVATNPWTLAVTSPPSTSLPGAVKIFRPR